MFEGLDELINKCFHFEPPSQIMQIADIGDDFTPRNRSISTMRLFELLKQTSPIELARNEGKLALTKPCGSGAHDPSRDDVIRGKGTREDRAGASTGTGYAWKRGHR